MMKITRTQNNELNNAINTTSGYIASVDGSLFETNRNAIIGSIKEACGVIRLADIPRKSYQAALDCVYDYKNAIMEDIDEHIAALEFCPNLRIGKEKGDFLEEVAGRKALSLFENKESKSCYRYCEFAADVLTDDLMKKFSVENYSDITNGDYCSALDFIMEWEFPVELKEMCEKTDSKPRKFIYGKELDKMIFGE